MASTLDTLAARLSSFVMAHRELLLAAGAVAGLVAALTSMVAPTERVFTFGSVVAYVNDGTILRADYERAIAALQTDRRSPLSTEDKERVLSRLIEEELLVQRASELGLTESDPSVRKLLIRTMLETIATQGRPVPGERELRAYFEANRELFASAPLVQVERIRVQKTASDAEGRLGEIKSALERGESFFDVKAKLSDPEFAPLPSAPIPAAKLRDYLGAEIVARLLAMPEDGISPPLDTGFAIEIFHLVSKNAPAPRFEDVAEEVIARYAREQDEEAMRDYLAQLKARAEIEIDASLFQ